MQRVYFALRSVRSQAEVIKLTTTREVLKARTQGGKTNIFARARGKITRNKKTKRLWRWWTDSLLDIDYIHITMHKTDVGLELVNSGCHVYKKSSKLT